MPNTNNGPVWYCHFWRRDLNYSDSSLMRYEMRKMSSFSDRPWNIRVLLDPCRLEFSTRGSVVKPAESILKRNVITDDGNLGLQQTTRRWGIENLARVLNHMWCPAFCISPSLWVFSPHCFEDTIPVFWTGFLVINNNDIRAKRVHCEWLLNILQNEPTIIAIFLLPPVWQ